MTNTPPTNPDETAPHPRRVERPKLGSMVRYVGRLGIHATRTAIVTCTVDTLDPAGDAPPLDDNMHAHLHVFTPSERGFFVEFNVPYDPAGAPGTWHWPPRPGPLVAGPTNVVHFTGPPGGIQFVPVPYDPRTGRVRT